MTIEIFKISSTDLPHHPAYVAGDLSQIQKVCELLRTDRAVWSKMDIDTLGGMAATGKFDMHVAFNKATITFRSCSEIPTGRALALQQNESVLDTLAQEFMTELNNEHLSRAYHAFRDILQSAIQRQFPHVKFENF